jgi:hypothetical protein
MRRSFRIAHKTFAAEAAALVNISDKKIRSWGPPSPLMRSEAVQKVKTLLDKCEATNGSQNKALVAFDIYMANLEHMNVFAFHPRYIGTQITKANELIVDCQKHMENSDNFTLEERLRFVRLLEFLTIYVGLLKRVASIHSPL